MCFRLNLIIFMQHKVIVCSNLHDLNNIKNCINRIRIISFQIIVETHFLCLSNCQSECIAFNRRWRKNFFNGMILLCKYNKKRSLYVKYKISTMSWKDIFAIKRGQFILAQDYHINNNPSNTIFRIFKRSVEGFSNLFKPISMNLNPNIWKKIFWLYCAPLKRYKIY